MKILFVGNSFVHGHEEPVLSYNHSAVVDLNGSGDGGVPGILQKFCAEAGVSAEVTIEAVSGETLAFHADKKVTLLSQKSYDVAILQELSTGPLPRNHSGDPQRFQDGAARVGQILRSKNPAAKLFLYETWASPASIKNEHYASLQEMQDDLRASYHAEAAVLHAKVAPVGEAFLRAVMQGAATPDNKAADGKMQLWAEDDRHASRYGSYLSACVIFGAVTGYDLEKLPSGDGSAARELGISAEQAITLHRLALVQR